MSSPYAFANLAIKKCQKPGIMQPKENLVFGKYFTDHMIEADWEAGKGWDKPKIVPLHNLSIPFSNATLHYAIECFEGMKAYSAPNGKDALLFRPLDNMKRFKRSCARLALPEIDPIEATKSIAKLVEIDQRFLPKEKGYSLYIRPTMIAMDESLGVHPPHHAKFFTILSPVGPYFKSGFKPVSLIVDPRFIRAFPGGTGGEKLGANYGPTVYPQQLANKRGYDQLLWVHGENHTITECGAMNLFTHWINEEGEEEVITAPLDGTVLPGVTRSSVIEICKKDLGLKVTENKPYNMKQMKKAAEEGRIKELFTSGTAVVCCGVSKIHYEGADIEVPVPEQSIASKVLNGIMEIQYGNRKHSWSVSTKDVLTKW